MGVEDGSDPVSQLLGEQILYYRAVAREYLDHALSLTGASEIQGALEKFAPTGDVLELACGPGTWTGELARLAASVTAVDASPEMLAIASAKSGVHGVRFVQADLFSWRPERRYDVVFFGFWLSHVPNERFDAFWRLVADCLVADGRVFFVDDAYRTADELIEGEASSTIQRRLNDGTVHRAVKVPHDPGALQNRLEALGWDFAITQTEGPFFWGSGRRS
jgi:SAM-dependent methyltransferase